MGGFLADVCREAMGSGLAGSLWKVCFAESQNPDADDMGF